MDNKTLKQIKTDTLKSVGNKFDKDLRFDKEKEVRIVLKNSYIIDEYSIDEYIARDGYFALEKAVNEMKPTEVTEVVKDSGLKGRSGGGFPTGVKWGFIPKNDDQKFIICNADEGESAATVDGVLMRQDPHSVLEGMALAGYAVGATKGYIYLRYEYPVAEKVLNKAIEDAVANNILGKNIFGSDFNFEVEVFKGAGAYVCGEETAIISSIEGNRGNSRNKPPFPAIKGLFGKPTVINNVETLSVVPQIITNGADWYKSTGIQGSEGSKVFTLTGHVKEPKTVEVPLGLTIRELVELAGGMREGRELKAFVTGSPNITMLGKEDIDMPVAFPEFKERQVMVGSGGVVIVDDQTCMIDFIHFNTDLLSLESCGRCTPCRVGTRRTTQFLEKIKKGEATIADFEKMQDLAEHMRTASLCGLGIAVGMTMHTAMHSFKDEFLAHIKDHKCAAGKCFK
ncbi:NADH-ubiquinone oxidoreductase-F iron-sulfur binding region domain-containing protein [Mycoplasmatota bacterium WC44]